MRRLATLGLSAVLVGSVGACGGGPSKAGFIKSADAACTTAGMPVAKLKAPTAYPELVTAASAVAKAGEAHAAELSAKGRPKGDVAVIDEVAGGLRTMVKQAGILEGAAKRTDDTATASSARAASDAFKGAKAKAAEYGFTTCAGGLSDAVDALFSGAATVVRAGFTLKADTLCREAGNRVDRLTVTSSGLPAVGRFLGSYVTIESKLVTDLRALVVAPGDEAKVTAWLDAMQRSNDKNKELRDAATAGNARRYDTISEESDVLVTAANAKADALDLPACGTEGAF